MTDPFDRFRLPPGPVAPDPSFVADLRRRLESALLQPEGTIMTTSETRVDAPLRSLTPYLAVTDARAATDFYVEVFGAVRRAEPIVMADGRIGHAELAIGDCVLMLAEEFPEIGHRAPVAGGAAPSLRVEVPDVDGSVERALRGGATLLRPVEDTGHGRGGTILDPFGHRWMVASAPARAREEAPEPRHGEAGYFTFTVPDDEAAKAFYGAVLGWQFSPGSAERTWAVTGSGLRGAGMGAGRAYRGWKLMYNVDDLDAALGRVRSGGGRAGAPELRPYGRIADCVDNQGVEFWLCQPLR